MLTMRDLLQYIAVRSAMTLMCGWGYGYAVRLQVS